MLLDLQDVLNVKQEHPVLLDLQHVLNVKQEHSVLLDLQHVLNVKQGNIARQELPTVIVSRIDLDRVLIDMEIKALIEILE